MQDKVRVTAFFKLLFVAGMVVLLIALVTPLAQLSAREKASHESCKQNLRSIVIALVSYEAVHGTLPPAYTVDSDGNRLHSWRTLILPYLEKHWLYDLIDMSKPWDDPANRQARETPVENYVCLSSPGSAGLTNYLAVVGPDSAFSGSVPRDRSEITDNPSVTISVVEVDTKQAVHWMSPYDTSKEMLLKTFKESRLNHPGTMPVAFLDGHIDMLSAEIDKDTLKAMLTIAGGETIDNN